MTLLSKIIDAILLIAIVYYLAVSPYTKVEESFNTHAAYDILFNGVDDLSNYDHIEFPGAVRRSFVGALVLSAPMKLVLSKVYDCIDTFLPDGSPLKITNLSIQFLVRLLLGILNWLGFVKLKNSVAQACNRSTSAIGIWFGLLLCSQFHIMYYSSRLLPNFIALPLVNVSLSTVILGDVPLGLAILSFVGVVFRVEILFLTGILALVCLYNRQSNLYNTVSYGLIGLLAGALTSYYIDTYFWLTPTLPELESFVYNVIDGNSSNWGTEPFHAYFTNYFEKLFVVPLIPLLAIPGFFIDLVNYRVKTIQSLSIASLLYVIFMSFLPHKEWRFIVYSIPGLIASAATSISYFSNKKGFVYKLFTLLVITLSCLSITVSLSFGYISSYNYPGGEAITNLNLRIYEQRKNDPFKAPLTVHIDVPACMTGSTLFTRIRDQEGDLNTSYDKTEDINKLTSNNNQLWNSFDYVITTYNSDHPDPTVKSIKLPEIEGYDWLKVDITETYDGINCKAIISLGKEILRNPIILFQEILTSLLTGNINYFQRLFKGIVRTKPYLFLYEKEIKGSFEFAGL